MDISASVFKELATNYSLYPVIPVASDIKDAG
jgi:hypothetical protein